MINTYLTILRVCIYFIYHYDDYLSETFFPLTNDLPINIDAFLLSFIKFCNFNKIIRNLNKNVKIKKS